MKKNKKIESKLIFGIILAIIAILVIAVIIDQKLRSNAQNNDNSQTSELRKMAENQPKVINYNEDISMIGFVTNLTDVMWNNAQIIQNGKNMQVIINIHNESQEQVGKKTLTVVLLNKDGKVIATKDTTIEGLEPTVGATTLQFEIPDVEPDLVSDIQIVAK